MPVLLTTTHPPTRDPLTRRRRRPLRLGRFLVALLVLLSLYAFSPRISALRRTSTALPGSHIRPPPTPPPPPPPFPPFPVDKGMSAITEWESALPQIAPLDIHGAERYLRFLNENWGVGFNNQLQEIIGHAHLAYLSNRSYVVQPLNFPGDNEWYPLSAFFRGALVGSPSSPHDHAYTADPILAPHPPPRPLRAVSRAHFASACPDYEHAPELDYDALARTRQARHSAAAVDSDPAHAPRDTRGPRPAPSYMSLSVGPLAHALGFEQDPPADVIMRGWEDILGIGGGRAKGAARSAPSSVRDSADTQQNNTGSPTVAPGDATCVTVDLAREHLFDYRVYSTNRILPLVPELVASPVFTDLHWSPLVHAATQRNLRAWGWVARACAATLSTTACTSRGITRRGRA
ncbi:hypothetical protein JB92DRAFT_735190 [Gautieria morchelliformis]|nr:hypothetical protein JB92DRAFT_735190 [Gautieria morchelliformis]